MPVEMSRGCVHVDVSTCIRTNNKYALTWRNPNLLTSSDMSCQTSETLFQAALHEQKNQSFAPSPYGAWDLDRLAQLHILALLKWCTMHTTHTKMCVYFLALACLSSVYDVLQSDSIEAHFKRQTTNWFYLHNRLLSLIHTYTSRVSNGKITIDVRIQVSTCIQHHTAH